MTKDEKKMCWIGGIIVVLVMVAISGTDSSNTSSAGSDHGSAASACHTAVTPMLAAPATANFHDDTFNTGQFGDVEVTGEVDSENGFGALLTSVYTCDVAGGNVIGTPTLLDSQGTIYGGSG